MVYVAQFQCVANSQKKFLPKRRQGPKSPGGGFNVLRRAGRGPQIVGGMKKIRDPLNSIAAEKIKVFRKGLEGKV